jgi:hypothetical protein
MTIFFEIDVFVVSFAFFATMAGAFGSAFSSTDCAVLSGLVLSRGRVHSVYLYTEYE